MARNNELTVTTIPNNWHGQRPRRPLVHLMHTGESYSFNSFSFHPKYAAKIIEAIRLAAASARHGKRRKDIAIDLGKDDEP